MTEIEKLVYHRDRLVVKVSVANEAMIESKRVALLWKTDYNRLCKLLHLANQEIDDYDGIPW